jgi:hypothetical protein
MATIATTIISSISVNPAALFRFIDNPSQQSIDALFNAAAVA